MSEEKKEMQQPQVNQLIDKSKFAEKMLALKLQQEFEMRQEMQKEMEDELISLRRKIEIQNQLLEMSQRNFTTE